MRSILEVLALIILVVLAIIGLYSSRLTLLLNKHECPEPLEPIVVTEKVYIYKTIIREPEEPRKEVKEKTTRGGSSKEFVITAYDNSPESQGKWVDQTATGFNLKGHSLESAKCIAVDPKIIPLGSKVQLTFDKEYEHLNGVYIARDTGGAIKGNKIDLFMGDGVDKQVVRNFGRRKVNVNVLSQRSD